MEKDSQAKIGRTTCDFCDQLFKLAVGRFLVCEAHVYRARQTLVKEASDASDIPLKAAPIAMQDSYRG